MKREIETIDYIQLFTRIVVNLHWIILFLSICIAFVFIFARYRTKSFTSEALFLIDDRIVEKKLTGLASGEMYEGVYEPTKLTNIKNQIIEFQNYSGLKNTIKNLNLETEFHVDGNVKKSNQLSHLHGIDIKLNKNHIQPLYCPFMVSRIAESRWKLEVNTTTEGYDYGSEERVEIEKRSIVHIFTANAKLENESISLDIIVDEKVANEMTIGRKHSFSFLPYDEIVEKHKENLSLILYDEDASIVKVIFTSKVEELGIQFTNALMTDYLQYETNLKKREGEKMLSFINEQLTLVSKRIKSTEEQIKDFELKNSSLELKEQSSETFLKIEETQDKLYNLELNQRYYAYIKNSLDTTTRIKTLIFPFKIIEGNELLIQLLENLNETADEYFIEAGSYMPSKRKLKLYKQEYIDIKTIANQNIRDLITDVEQKIADQKNLLNEAISKETQIPKAKLEYLSLKRNFSIDDEIYTYLLQSQTEMKIRLSSITPSNRVINEAHIVKSSEESDIQTFYLVAILIGLLFPISYIFLSDLAKGKILTSNDLAFATEKEPLITIGHCKQKNRFVTNDLHNILDEQFAKLRLILLHKLENKATSCILITSSQEREGKTFCAINLALSMAYFGKKTLLLGADTRRPKLKSYFIQQTEYNLIDYIKTSLPIEHITNPSQLLNLHVIFGGTTIDDHSLSIPEVKRLNSLFSSLEEKYDIIIIDSAPMGISSETLNYIQFSDFILYTTRSNTTTKSKLQNLNSFNDICGSTPSDYILNDYHRIGSKHYPYRSKYSFGIKKVGSLFSNNK